MNHGRGMELGNVKDCLVVFADGNRKGGSLRKKIISSALALSLVYAGVCGIKTSPGMQEKIRGLMAQGYLKIGEIFDLPSGPINIDQNGVFEKTTKLSMDKAQIISVSKNVRGEIKDAKAYFKYGKVNPKLAKILSYRANRVLTGRENEEDVYLNAAVLYDYTKATDCKTFWDNITQVDNIDKTVTFLAPSQKIDYITINKVEKHNKFNDGEGIFADFSQKDSDYYQEKDSVRKQETEKIMTDAFYKGNYSDDTERDKFMKAKNDARENLRTEYQNLVNSNVFYEGKYRGYKVEIKELSQEEWNKMINN